MVRFGRSNLSLRLAISFSSDAQPSALIAAGGAAAARTWLVIGHAHHSERIGSMRGPIMFWSEIDQAMLVALGMICPQGIDARCAAFVIDPDAWKVTARDFDPVHRCRAALVRHNLSVEARRLQRRLV